MNRQTPVSSPALRASGRRLAGLLVGVCVLAACRVGVAETHPAHEPGRVQEYARVVFGPDTVVAEIASTPRAHEMGLMFRDSLPDGTGMLFVFEEEEVRGFWMDNTYIDLDVAFIDASFRIIGFERLEAMDKEVKDSPAPFMYALEVPLGWFEAHGVSVGDTVRIEGVGFDAPQRAAAPPTVRRIPASAAVSLSSL